MKMNLKIYGIREEGSRALKVKLATSALLHTQVLAKSIGPGFQYGGFSH